MPSVEQHVVRDGDTTEETVHEGGPSPRAPRPGLRLKRRDRLRQAGDQFGAGRGVLRRASPLEPVPLGWGPVRTYATHREIDVGFRSSDGAILAGTLLLPAAPGRYPAVLMHFGSDRWRRAPYSQVGGFLALGMAVLTYDKKGVGQSQGRCCPFADPDYFPLLAADVLAGVRQLATHPEIRVDAIGLFGFSQGGWVVPIAAAEAPGEIAFTIIGSGPAVTLGEELLYSRLSGEDRCTPSARSAAEIDSALTRAGPSGFDPIPFIQEMNRPGLWIYGDLDLSIPVARSVQHLAAIRDTLSRPFTIVVVPGINHNWVPNGSICQRTGPDWDDGQIIIPWLRRYGLIAQPTDPGSAGSFDKIGS